MEHLESDTDRTPFGTLSQNTVWANADHFTLTAAGIPGLYFNTVGTQYLTRNYHTNYDIVSNVNFGYLAQNIAVINDIWVDHDRADAAAARLRRARRRGRRPASPTRPSPTSRSTRYPGSAGARPTSWPPPSSASPRRRTRWTPGSPAAGGRARGGWGA